MLHNTLHIQSNNYNASTNTPALATATGYNDNIFQVTTQGIQTINGVSSFCGVGDEIVVSNGVSKFFTVTPVQYNAATGAVGALAVTIAQLQQIGRIITISVAGTQTINGVSTAMIVGQAWEYNGASWLNIVADLSPYAQLAANQTFTGNNTFAGATKVPTIAGTTDSSTSAASTAFVQAIAALKAPLISPAFTNTPTAPTAALENKTTQLATTEFAYNLKGNFKTVVSIGGTSTLSVVDMGKVIENVAGGYINLILPNVSTVPNGSVVGILNAATADMTVSTQAGQLINNGTQHAVSVTIPVAGSCILYTDQTSWTMIALGGSMVATPADVAVLVGQISILTSQQFGINQNWQNYDVATARGWNITYTNTTSKAIVVEAQGTATTAAPNIYPRVNGVTLAGNGGTSATQLMFNITVVPPGQTYQMLASNIILNRWSELR